VWTGSNHDVSRLATRWCGGDPTKVRLALLMLLTLRGTPVLYQGDEIGLTDGTFEKEQLLDPVGLRFWPHYAGRDPERTPMPWDDGPTHGFTAAGVTPWLAMADAPMHVAGQRAEPESVLHLVRAVIALRRASPDLLAGDYRRLPGGEGSWVFRRGARTVVALNVSAEHHEIALPAGPGTVVLGTHRHREGSATGDVLGLGPWEGVVLTSRG
jgi:alpha-glucosidase